MTLLKMGANKEITTRNGRTPLHISALEGYVGIVKLLLEIGADKQVLD